MPIPSEEEKLEDMAKIKALLDLPEDWEVEYEVRPWLGYDLGYEIDRENKKVEITAYSARYPHSFTHWISGIATEIRLKLGLPA